MKAREPRTRSYRLLRQGAGGRVTAAAALAGLALAAFDAARTALAGPPTGSGNYGVHLGYSKAAEAEDGDMLVGGHIEARLAPALGIRASVDYNGTEEYAIGSGLDPALQVRTIPVTLGARLYLPLVSGFSPFLAAGGGWYNVIYDYPSRLESLGFDDERVSTFGWHLGLGGKWNVAERVSIYGEGRYTFVDPDKKLGDEVQEEIGEFDYDRSDIVAGISLEF